MDRSFYHPEVETLARTDLETLQLQRLQQQVRRCYEASAFYRERLQRAGVTPEDIRNLSDIRRIPFTTKSDLRDEQAAHPPYGRFALAPAGNWREVHPSSGTTGTPVLTLWSESDVRHITEVTARTLWSFGIRPGDVIQNAFSYGLWVAGLAVHYAGRAMGAFVIPIGAQLTDKQIFFLTRSRASCLTATPSYGLHIAEKLAQSGIGPQDLALKAVALGGEAGTEAPATRAKLEQRFGCTAVDYYGLAEIGPTFASECSAKSGLHWSEDHHLIEVIDPESGEPAPPGHKGVLVITHLTREATPMLRYWTNDYTILDTAPCACGRTHARSPGGILGRHDDLIVYRGAKFYPVNVESAVRAMPELTDEYRIEITLAPGGAVGRCTVLAELVAGGHDEAMVVEGLKARLKAACLVTPDVRLVPDGTLERTEFKAKRIIHLEA